MSLIGPRPERKEFVQQFNSEIPGYPLRHKAKTGISGWAQVNGLRGIRPSLNVSIVISTIFETGVSVLISRSLS